MTLNTQVRDALKKAGVNIAERKKDFETSAHLSADAHVSPILRLNVSPLNLTPDLHDKSLSERTKEEAAVLADQIKFGRQKSSEPEELRPAPRIHRREPIPHVEEKRGLPGVPAAIYDLMEECRENGEVLAKFDIIHRLGEKGYKDGIVALGVDNLIKAGDLVIPPGFLSDKVKRYILAKTAVRPVVKNYSPRISKKKDEVKQAPKTVAKAAQTCESVNNAGTPSQSIESTEVQQVKDSTMNLDNTSEGQVLSADQAVLQFKDNPELIAEAILNNFTVRQAMVIFSKLRDAFLV